MRTSAIGVGTVHLILPVLAIPVEIADPVIRYALLSVAGEGVWPALDLVAIVLIRVVSAVVVAIALPKFGYTEAAVASEMIGRAAVGNLWARGVGERLNAAWTHALPVQHDHVIRAQADEAVIRGAQAQMRALRIVGALVCTGLDAVCVHLNVHEATKYTNNIRNAEAMIFISIKDRRLFPIIPVHNVFKNSYSKWMGDAFIILDNLLKTVSVKVGGSDIILTRIDPINTLGNVINCDT